MIKARIHISLPPSLLKQVDETCELNWVTRCEFIRAAIKFYLAYINDEKGEED